MINEMEFSDTAVRCLALAGELAARRGHSQINTGHLLLAFFEEGSSRAFIVLDSIGIEGYDVKKELDRLKPRIGRSVENPGESPEFADLLSRVRRLCLDRKCTVVEEHLLLMAAMEDENFLAYRIVKNLGFNPDMIISESEARD